MDLELPAEALTYQLAFALRNLEPYGAGNPCPVFCTRGLRLLSEPQLIRERHLKLRLAGPQNRPLEAIWFNCIEGDGQTPDVKGSIELAYTIETNVWNDEVRLQLNVQDLRCE